MQTLFRVCAKSPAWEQSRFTASYINKWMRRDVKRRALSKEYNNERIRLNAIRKNNILPKELQVSRNIVALSLAST